MKNLVLIFCFIFFFQNSYSQTVGDFYDYINKPKDMIKKELASLQYIKDWGKGSDLTMEDKDMNMFRFRFTENDVCDGVSYMSFKDQTERINKQLEFIKTKGWELDLEWKHKNFNCKRFKKGDKLFYAKESGNKVFEIGRPGSIKWPPTPEEAKKIGPPKMKRLTEAQRAKVTASEGGIFIEITSKTKGFFKGKLISGKTEYKSNDIGEITLIEFSRNMKTTIRLGTVKVLKISGDDITFKIVSVMDLKINGKLVDPYKLNSEVHFAQEKK